MGKQITGFHFSHGHGVVFGIAVSLIESYSFFFSDLTGFDSTYIFYAGLLIAGVFFLLGLLELSDK